jgi:hypothetical protein
VIWVALAVLMLVVKLPALAAALLFFAIWAAWRISARNARAASLRGWLDRALLLLLSFLQPVVREFARLRGMILYAARPTWRPHLPDILPPVKPRKISIRLATLTFWSESGGDRYHLIEALRHHFVHERRLFRQDDGWRWFDLELNPQNDLSCSLLTVTEYYGGGRCLTRVRCMLRLRRGLVWNVVLWLAFAALLATLPLPIGLLGLIGGGATLVLIPVAIHLIRRDLITLTQTAAQSVELSVVSAATPQSTAPPA